MPELQTTPAGQAPRPETQAASPQAANPLKATNYAQGAKSVAPKKQNLLSPAAERSAVRYNEQRGFSREQVRRYQNVVRTPDDGSFGPNTVEAIAAFQRANALEVDGRIGPATELALEARAMPDLDHDGKHKVEDDPLSSGALTANFSLSEFASKDGRGTPRSVVPKLRELAQNLEVLRAEVGPIAIISGYRSPQHNLAVGGAKSSYHMRGMAADITVGGMSPRQVKAAIEKLIRSGRMKQGGIGFYSGFVHYDTRGYAARW